MKANNHSKVLINYFKQIQPYSINMITTKQSLTLQVWVQQNTAPLSKYGYNKTQPNSPNFVKLTHNSTLQVWLQQNTLLMSKYDCY